MRGGSSRQSYAASCRTRIIENRTTPTTRRASATTAAALLSRAGNAIPKNAELVITTTSSATHDEKIEARELANAASDKVIARIAA
jgi:hypothetical protein